MPPKKRPLVQRVSINIPPLFSLVKETKLSDKLQKQCGYWFDKNIPILENLFKGQRLETKELKKLEDGLFCITKITKHPKFRTERGLQMLSIRIGVAHLLILISRSYIAYSKAVINFINQLIEKLSNIANQTDEIHWYRANILKWLSEIIGVSYEIINDTVNFVAKIKSGIHKRALESFVLQYYGPYYSRLYIHYPKYEPLEKLKSFFPAQPWGFKGFCATARHKFIMDRLQNQVLFKFDEECKPQKNHFWLNGKIYKDILKFIAHIAPPSAPTLFVDLPSAFKMFEIRFNMELSQQMYKRGLCSSEGFLKITGKKKKKYKKELINIIKSVLQNVIGAYLSIKEENNLNKNIMAHLNAKYSRLNKLIESLGFFNHQDALFLFRECLDERYPLIKKPIKYCLDNLNTVKKIQSKPKEMRIKHLLNLSGRIATDLQKQSVIIYVGTPLKRTNNLSNPVSTHAIYVALKKLPGDFIQIIITNGGTGCNLHKESIDSDKRDRVKLHYAAFKKFNRVQKIYDLVDYIYRLLTMQYSLPNSSNDDATDFEKMTFEEQLGEIYLHEEKGGSTFWFYKSDGESKCRSFFREDLEETFLPQINSDCTVYNLKRSIKILFDMDELEFGLLEDNLVLGLDQLITEQKLLKETKPGVEEVKFLTSTEHLLQEVKKFQVGNSSSRKPENILESLLETKQKFEEQKNWNKNTLGLYNRTLVEIQSIVKKQKQIIMEASQREEKQRNVSSRIVDIKPLIDTPHVVFAASYRPQIPIYKFFSDTDSKRNEEAKEAQTSGNNNAM